MQPNRDVIVDGSLYGMGRGAGNAPTELLASYLNKKCGANYDIGVLLETMEKYILPIRDKVKWGYDLPMFICGIEHSHVDNVYHLQKKSYGIREMYDIISGLNLQQKTRYGKDYSKSDFSVLDALCKK